MKNAVLAVLFLGLVGMLAAVPAVAGSLLYDNTGPYSDAANPNPLYANAWGISGLWASDSFTVPSNSTVTGVDFDVWLSTGDTLTSVDWAIGTGPDVGTFATATITSLVPATNPTVYYGYYTIDVATFSIPDVSVSSGTTYYLTLQNAVAPEYFYAYWDISNGPSDAWEDTVGDVNNNLWSGTNSSTFQILGNASTSPVPEPASPSFLLAALITLGFAFAMRVRLRIAT
jgi:hypothetical protein